MTELIYIHNLKKKTATTLIKGGTEGAQLNLMKPIHDKPTADIILNSEKLKAFLLKSEMRQRCPFSSLLLNVYWNA